MKKILLLAICACCLTLVRAQNANGAVQAAQKTTPAEVLAIPEVEYDFGKIPQGKPVYHNFEIRNEGQAPLKLDNVQASCGCTTPQWSKDPIPARGAATIKVGYNAANEGIFEKTITIAYSGSLIKQIRIKGNVWKAPNGSAPANSAVQFLKQQIQ